MKEITQYSLVGVSTPVNEDSPNLTKWVKYTDHIKAIEAKCEEIAEDKTYISGLESIVKEQKKEIERLKEFIKPITEIGEPVKDGYFNMYVQYDFVQEAKELIK